jgi:hypothetical protein
MLIHRRPDPAEAEAAQRALLLDERLGLLTVGVLMKILNRAPEWQINAKTFHAMCEEGRGVGAESARSIRLAFRELETLGYMRRTKGKKSNGGFYTWLEVSDVPNQFAPFSLPEQPSEPVVGYDHGVMPAQGFVYVISPAGSSTVKIGTSVDVPSRLRGMQTSHPELLIARWSCPGNVELESFLHRRFDPIRVKGEWFDFGDADPVAEVSAAAEYFYELSAGSLNEPEATAEAS